MITRGYLIGEIVDNLSSIQIQVENRCAIGLTDLNKYLEDFFKEILNRAYGLSLVNLNSSRSNEPSLDLGDETNSIAFQVTSQKTVQKINSTLSKLTNDQISQYQKIIILVIGKKQNSYTPNEQLWDKTNFDFENIWDINTLLSRIILLPLETLKILYDYINNEVVGIKIELEIPDQNGNFKTNIDQFVESIPKPSFGNCEHLYLFYKTEYDANEITQDKLVENLKDLSETLTKLPRITRDFLSFLIERREKDKDSETMYFNYDKLERICHYSDFQGELRLLIDCGIISIDESGDPTQCPEISISYGGESGGFLSDLVVFVESRKINYKIPLVNLDFSKI